MSTLANMYDDIKSSIDKPAPTYAFNVGKDLNNPQAVQWTNIATRESDKLADSCAKKILLDIYCKIVPLDSDFVNGNRGMMKQDVDAFLNNKNMSATQYFTSCYEKTKSPLLEFVLRSCNNIGRKFMEDAKETLKDAQKNDLSIPPPNADPDSEDTENQLGDVIGTKDKPADMEYEEFIDKIKKKTIKRVISEVSDLINNKKYSKDTDTNLADVNNDLPMEESSVSIAADWLTKQLWNENGLSDNQVEMIIGSAIREATFNIIDSAFQQPFSDMRNYRTNIRLGKGIVVNESAINYIREQK